MIRRLPVLGLARVRVLGADQKKSGHWGRDCSNDCLFCQVYVIYAALKNGIRGNSCTYVCYRLMEMFQKLKIS